MTARVFLPALFLALTLPALADANEGVLLLAQDGGPAWQTELRQLVARVDAQKPADVVFGSPTRASVAAAVDRLARRGVTAVAAIPFFLAAPVAPDVFNGQPIPVSLAASPAGDAVLTDIIISRAQDVSPASAPVLVLIGFAGDDGGTPWAVDLQPIAQRLNGTRRFALILPIANPQGVTEAEQKFLTVQLERRVVTGKAIVVVPLVASDGVSDPSIAQRLHGFEYKVASPGVLADERVVQWIVAQKAAGPASR